MSSSKSLLDLLPAPKSNTNVFKPRNVAAPISKPENEKKTPTIAPLVKPLSSTKTHTIPSAKFSDGTIIASKPVPNTSLATTVNRSAVTANQSKIKKTTDFFGLSSYGNDTDDEEEEIEEEEVINKVSACNTQTPSNDFPIAAEILKYEGKKRRHDNSTINFVDVNVKDVIEKNKEQLLKNLTTEPIKPARTMGTGRKHHQITYLALMAKEREQELNKQWSDSKFNRKQSKMKYGF